MSAGELSHEAALRIGLAARVLPDTEPARLMKVLVAALGLPLDADKLGRLTARQLQTGGDGEFAGLPLPVVKQALDYLWGKATVTVDEQMPPVEPYTDGDMPGSIRVAVASNSGERIDGHFGSCARFLIYQVSASELRLIDVRATRIADASDDKNAARAALIGDCHLLYVVSIGGPAAAKVVKTDIHPVKMPGGGEARAVLGETQWVLASTPPPWLAKAMGLAAEARVRFERSEEEA